MGELDILETATTDIEPASRARLELELDLGDLRLDQETQESFDDLVRREQYRSGSLWALHKCRIALREGGTLILHDTHAGENDDTYLDMLQMLLGKAAFVDVRARRLHPTAVVEARRRPDLCEPYDYGMVGKEMVTPEDVLRLHEFAKEVYFYRDFNYNLEVSRQFDLNSDLYAVYDVSGTILAVGRAALRVPGYNCPFMHATTDTGNHYRIPSRYRRIGEIMGLFKEGRSGVVAFKKLMESMTQYAYGVAQLDSIWTTYDTSDPYTGTYYKTKLLMDETNIRLMYGDFGGRWNLICTDKIRELRNLHRDMFRR